LIFLENSYGLKVETLPKNMQLERGKLSIELSLAKFTRERESQT
jgi:hypothetical protein